MAEPNMQALIEAASAYERLFVPALFQEWANRVADAAGLRPGQRVLDVACGTGVLARAVAARVGPVGSVVGIDMNPGMLTVAGQIAPALDWRQAQAESLPFEDRSFDAVVSQFGLMFFGDRQAALREMGRVAVPGGQLVVAVWDSLEHSPAYAMEVALVERHAGSRAGVPLRSPFSLGDPLLLTALFADAGLSDARVTTYPGTARFPSIRSMVEADLRGWLPLMGVDLDPMTTDAILADAETALRSFVSSSGSVEFACPAQSSRPRKHEDLPGRHLTRIWR